MLRHSRWRILGYRWARVAQTPSKRSSFVNCKLKVYCELHVMCSLTCSATSIFPYGTLLRRRLAIRVINALAVPSARVAALASSRQRQILPWRGTMATVSQTTHSLTMTVVEIRGFQAKPECVSSFSRRRKRHIPSFTTGIGCG
jgi:hypothetical protein